MGKFYLMCLSVFYDHWNAFFTTSSCHSIVIVHNELFKKYKVLTKQKCENMFWIIIANLKLFIKQPNQIYK